MDVCIATPPWFPRAFFYLMLLFFLCGTIFNIPISKLLAAIMPMGNDAEDSLRFWSGAGMTGALISMAAAGCYYFFMYRPAMERLAAGVMSEAAMGCSRTIYLLWGY